MAMCDGGLRRGGRRDRGVGGGGGGEGGGHWPLDRPATSARRESAAGGGGWSRQVVCISCGRRPSPRAVARSSRRQVLDSTDCTDLSNTTKQIRLHREGRRQQGADGGGGANLLMPMVPGPPSLRALVRPDSFALTLTYHSRTLCTPLWLALPGLVNCLNGGRQLASCARRRPATVPTGQARARRWPRGGPPARLAAACRASADSCRPRPACRRPPAAGGSPPAASR